jgi:hypothetical protein
VVESRVQFASREEASQAGKLTWHLAWLRCRNDRRAVVDSYSARTIGTFENHRAFAMRRCAKVHFVRKTSDHVWLLGTHQLSRKLRSTLDRPGCLSFLSALASICRIRSRVSENCLPTSSKVWSLFMPRQGVHQFCVEVAMWPSWLTVFPN